MYYGFMRATDWDSEWFASVQSCRRPLKALCAERPYGFICGPSPFSPDAAS